MNRRVTAAAVVAVAAIVALAASGSGSNGGSSGSGTSEAPATTAAPALTSPPTRQVTGKMVTLGAGTFSGGTNVAAGLYDVTPGAGQTGNFIVTGGTNSYNEILGTANQLGVPKVRAQISQGDTIQISGLSQVTFTPVATQYVTSHTLVTLYAGTWTVGQDIGEGRYVATPGPAQSGNFIVQAKGVNEILGGSSDQGGVPNVTVNLSKGDVIAIASLSSVTMTPK